MLFPLIALVVGIVGIITIFNALPWLPILLIGFGVYKWMSMSKRWHQGGIHSMHGSWQHHANAMGEKWKRDFGSWDGEAMPKRKRDNHDYV